jgi:RNA polymerase sigma-70 factor (ECF subfamily)
VTAGSASDEDLLAQIADGDEAALEQLYRRFAPRIAGFLRKRMNDEAAIDDVLNTVMLEVWKSAGRYEGRSSAAGFILSIARHRGIDQVRRGGGREFEEVSEIMEDEMVINAQAVLEAAVDTRRLQACLEQLGATQREAVHLAFFEDLPYDEIAEVMSCPTGTVKTRVYHAKRALKKCLGQAEAGHA